MGTAGVWRTRCGRSAGRRPARVTLTCTQSQLMPNGRRPSSEPTDEGSGNPSACRTSRAWASVLFGHGVGRHARGGARRLREHRRVGGGVTRAGLARALRRRGQQRLHRDRRRFQAVAAVDALGQGQPGGRTGARRARLPRPQRADARGLLADGVGERRQRPATLVRPAVPGRRLRRAAVRRLRQPLCRPAGGLPVIPGDAVDPVAATGDRDADDAAIPRARPAAGRHPPGPGVGLRRPPRRGRR
ncbi:hypothetical protein BN971_04008 [Mycobacterium bohemicum DSM 44277]|uniref:Uncharacterized protein n=1 Tax=Mycobacterium bohemicum DSM 44277 TaxID=1236609 RepID=A0A0U0WD41_MYCBE|nr:hypothetical protein BN971_04008 [Mycobacterium bohemicum DSM 44277]